MTDPPPPTDPSAPAPLPVQSPAPLPAPAGPRYGRDDLDRIIARAAERQAHGTSDDLSLEEIQEIAAQVGIEPRHVAAAARELHRDGVLAHTDTRSVAVPDDTERPLVVELEGQLTEEGAEELLDRFRSRWAPWTISGSLTRGPGSWRWRSTDGMSWTQIAIMSRRGTTRIELHDDRRGAALIGGLVGGILLVLALLLAAIGVLEKHTVRTLLLPLIGGGALGGWGIGELLGARLERKWSRRLGAAADELEQHARALLAEPQAAED